MRRERPLNVSDLSDLHHVTDDEHTWSEPKLFGWLRGMDGAICRAIASGGPG